MIRLHTLDLSPNLVWSDRWGWSPVGQNLRRTLGGGLVVWHRRLIAGRPITLEGGQSWGWLTFEQVQGLADLAADSGARYDLELAGETFRVAFRHDEPPAFEARPLRPQNPEPGPETRFVAKIKLITVE